MSAILDDMDSRPGSTTSLLRTIVGLYLRRLGGWIAIADLLRLMGELGVTAPNARTAVVRLKQMEKEWIAKVCSLSFLRNLPYEMMRHYTIRLVFKTPTWLQPRNSLILNTQPLP